MAETFALGSPRAYQPSYAESSILSSMLGKLNGNDASRLGMMLLGNYQGERAAAESGYDQQVQAQNKFAYQQLQQQRLNELQKNAIELYGKPEGATLVAGTPSLQQAIGQDVNPNVALSAAQTLRAGELAKTLQAAGIGSYNLTEAGQPTNAASIGALIPGMQFSDQMPLSLQKEAMAQAGANSRAATANAPSGSFTQGGGTDEFGNPRPGMSVRVPKGNVAGAEDLFRRMQASGVFTNQPYGGGNNTGGGSPNPAGAGPGMGSTPPPGNNVSTQAGNPYDVRTPAGQATQQHGRALLGVLEQKARGGDQQAAQLLSSVRANMGGGSTLPMRPNSKGQPGLIARTPDGREVIISQ